MPTISAKKMLLLGFIVLLLVAIPLSVYIVQKQQQTKTQAAQSTSLFFNPTKQNATKIGEIISFDIMIDPDPGAGTPPNKVSFAKITINYDPLMIATAEAGLVPTDAFKVVLEEPTYTDGSASVTLSIGPASEDAIQTKTKIATISFKTLAQTNGTKITFASDTQVLSVGTDDKAGENVLSTSPGSATVIVTSPTPGPTTTPSPSNITCSGLGLDRSATGIAPYSITFTGSANASVGTITKASFNFGDGPVEDVLEGGGIGTKSVSIQKAHTYNNQGSYTASVIFTGSDGSLSSIGNCTQVITVNPPGIGGLPTPIPTGSESAQITPPVISPEIIPTEITIEPSEFPILSPIPPTGPSAKIIGIGIAGLILSIIGGIIFFTL